ncbi:insecticidal toxin protein [Morganella morganii]|uniref:Tc toxin subunit A-related protein n=1 Tax=Morganella morganii TaxID=582 RepID=UPI00164AD9A2|nr:neuraminidase-like domain-containing protein [Morganella morganii]MBC4010302.1 insecticidal toxin protein [Morganella morganii]
MNQTTRIIEKLNQGRSDQQLSLSDLMPLSLSEIRNMAGSRLSREEAQMLHRAAIKEKQNNILYTARALTRANPLLRKEMGAARNHGAAPYGYNDIIMPRADEFAAPGAVSSMFSPAGYLTELYREARGLHQKGNVNNLDTRRPDLAELMLSQENLDNEISTLSLANKQLETALMAKAGQTDKAKYYETLATSRRSGVTPYNMPFEGIRNALEQQDFVLPDHVLSKGAQSAAQLALAAGITPELYAILTEKTDGLSEAETEALLKKNFPGVNTDSLMNLDALANYYGLPRDEIQEMLEKRGTETPNAYRDNKLVSHIIDADGKITLSEMHRSESFNRDDYYYVDLIPQGKNHYLFNFSVTTTKRHLRIFQISRTNSSESGYFYRNTNFSPLKDLHYSIPITPNIPLTEKDQAICIFRLGENPINYAAFLFTPPQTVSTPTPWLLTLNKLLRLAKATGMTPLETQRALTRLRFSKNETDTIILHRFTEALHYRKRYGIDTETALMLCNTDISQVSYDGQLSQFDRLFNHPPLNGVTYTLGGDISIKPDAEDPRRETLKRAFRVDNTGLWQIFDITDRSDSDKSDRNNIENLSDLLLVRLLADVHNLTVAQLDALLRISPYSTTPVYKITDEKRRELITFLYQTTQWLNAQNITVEQLVILLTTDAPATPTTEMTTLLDSLRNGGIDSTDTTTLHTTMAPVIAAAMQLETPEQGKSLLRWLDNNHPKNVLTTKDIWPLITTEKPSADQQKKQAAWCQALAQRVLVIRTLALSHPELQVLSQGAPAETIAALREISDFHNLINRCGEQAGTVLDALQSKTLTSAALAKSLQLSEHVIIQALTQAGQSTTLTTWQQLATLPSRLDLADNLHITPKDITNLLTVSENASPSYTDLTKLAGLLQAGLNKQQTKQLQDQSEPRRSEALSGEYRSLIMGKPLANRDDIWRRLLIDGKVSAEITTTRLADAIAGIQLYINRTIAGDEPGASSAVLERQFFKDWDTYNKRYSTWAGVSQLVYYPENYIDPTIRVGQTGMMNTMLEQLSQSELNSDTLEDGFRQYLTAFEQVANLKVVSGYHDAVNIDEGNTWFIGTSQTEPKKYYWRKADHSKCQNGRFAANAWSDWKEITCAVNPYQDMVRPVIFRSRLYLLWIEEQVRKDGEGKKDISSFTLKLTHIKYDGSWASPFSYDVTDEFIKMKEGRKGLYCTENPGKNALAVACYLVKDSYDDSQKKTTQRDNNKEQEKTEHFGRYIFSDMSVENIPDILSVLEYTAPQLDTTTITRVNSLLLHSYDSTLTPEDETGTSNANISLNAKHYYLSTYGNKTHFIFNSDVDVHIHVDFIPSLLRPEFITQMSFGASSYRTEGAVYSPTGDFPGGECTVSLTENIKSGINIIYLSVPGNDKTLPFVNSTVLSIATPDGASFYNCTHYGSDKNRHYFTCEIGELISDHPADKTIIALFIKNKSSKNEKIGFIKYSKINKNLTTTNLKNCSLEYIHNSNTIRTFKAESVSFLNTTDDFKNYYTFHEHRLDITDFIHNKEVSLTLQVKFKNDSVDIARKYKLNISVPGKSLRAISLHTTEDGAQYMEWDAYRTRLNTLFARQLIERANRGIDAVLSPETQSLREPKPGQGTYVTLTLKPYDPKIHGNDRKFTIYHNPALPHTKHIPMASGILSTETSTEVKIFFSRMDASTQDINQFWIDAEYEKGTTTPLVLYREDGNTDPHGWKVSQERPGFPGLESVSGLSQPDEPMDFSGANALYFWELFYYTPMMVAMRLLQEQNFTEANRWLSYIWQPAASGAGDWRVRPLLEDTSWNADPLDSVDPDAVAQNDPMHYKVSTLMKLLDLLIARGDSAYRMLERDTLNEAKMWYMQALDLLGDKPITITGSSWGNPSLSNAANQTKTKQRQDMISGVRNGGLLPDVRTANTLTGLFLPQQNEKLLGYWQTLEMRLFNLRNNLSIDGQPLSLPIFAAPADPAALLSAAAAASGGSKALPSAAVPAMRFPQALESARSLTGQLMQFGSSLQGLIERQDAEAMSELLQNQAGELMLSSLRMQAQALTELDAEKKTLEQSRAGAQSRFDSYRALYDENVSAAEKRTMDLNLSSAVLSTSIGVLDMAAAAADMAPNVFGLAVGGSRWGGIPKAIGSGIGLAASAIKITADNISQSEAWRRRRQEWEIQKNNAESEVKQIDAQLEALAVRRTATEMQREHLEIQQAQTQAQLEFLQRKFSNKALYSWLRGRLASIYYRFYDLTATRCMMAEAAFAWQTGETTRYIKPGAWQSNNAGLMAGESLLLNLTEMEQAWLKWNHRTLKVTRTVSLAKVYKGYETPVNLTEKIADLLKGSGSGDTPAPTGLSMTKDKQLHAAFNLKALNIAGNYPAGLGKTRRIKQISVTLPALTGPYQDVRAVLSYGGDVRLPDGCKAIAVSHGMNDDGQFRLDFNDGHWLPFEGIPVDNDSSLTLSFPETTDEEQKALLLSLSDIIIHIRYTIR